MHALLIYYFITWVVVMSLPFLFQATLSPSLLSVKKKNLCLASVTTNYIFECLGISKHVFLSLFGAHIFHIL